MSDVLRVRINRKSERWRYNPQRLQGTMVNRNRNSIKQQMIRDGDRAAAPTCRDDAAKRKRVTAGKKGANDNKDQKKNRKHKTQSRERQMQNGSRERRECGGIVGCRRGLLLHFTVLLAFLTLQRGGNTDQRCDECEWPCDDEKNEGPSDRGNIIEQLEIAVVKHGEGNHEK